MGINGRECLNEERSCQSDGVSVVRIIKIKYNSNPFRS
jgi:hypothetical protein